MTFSLDVGGIQAVCWTVIVLCLWGLWRRWRPS